MASPQHLWGPRAYLGAKKPTWYWPLGHGVQPDPPLNLPAEQPAESSSPATHAAEPAAADWPAGQLVQADEADPEL